MGRHRRSFLAAAAAAAVAVAVAVAGRARSAPVPVIVDTDVGDFFDDFAALALLVSNRSAVDVRLVTTAFGDTTAKARVLARFLEQAGRDDIPVAVGEATRVPAYPGVHPGLMLPWGDAYDLARYRGGVRADGVEAAAMELLGAAERGEALTVVALAPATNFPPLYRRYGCNVTSAARLVAMGGAIRVGYNGSSHVEPEYNVKRCASCYGRMLEGPWVAAPEVAPLDASGAAVVSGDSYRRVLDGGSRVGEAFDAALMYWAYAHQLPGLLARSDTWFDATAAVMAVPSLTGGTAAVTTESLRLSVTAQGMTVVDPHGTPVAAATGWAGDGLKRFGEAMARAASSE